MLATPAHIRRSFAARSCLVVLLALPALAATTPESHLRRSVQLMQEGNLELAETEAKLALNDPAGEAVALALLGSIRLQQQEYQAGASLLERAIKADPNLVGARLNLAQAYAFLGKHDHAEGLFGSVLKLAPDNLTARLALPCSHKFNRTT